MSFSAGAACCGLPRAAARAETGAPFLTLRVRLTPAAAVLLPAPEAWAVALDGLRLGVALSLAAEEAIGVVCADWRRTLPGALGVFVDFLLAGGADMIVGLLAYAAVQLKLLMLL